MYRETVAEGVDLICGFPRYAINAYLIGDVLLDCLTGWQRRSLPQSLQNWDRVPSRVVLTHVHPDHLGAAASVCDRFGIPLGCHAADVAAAEGREPMQPAGWRLAISRAIFGGDPHSVDQPIAAGDEVGGFRVLHTPGHTLGHIALFRESDATAIVGDVVFGMSPATCRPGLYEPPDFFTVDPAANRRSITEIQSLRPARLLFGHGPPWTDQDAFAAWAAGLGPRESSG